MYEVIIDGRINEEGKLMIAHDGDYLEFLRMHKQSRVRIAVRAISEKDPRLSAWYFENVVLPKFQAGLMKMGYEYNDIETLDFIRKECPYKLEGKADTIYYNKLNEWCKRYAAENLDTVIND